MNHKYVEKEYNKLASIYDVKWKGYLRSTHDVAIQILDPKPNDVILDASGGTGLLAEQIINLIGSESKITIVDISEKMLNIAKQKLKKYHNIKILQNNVHKLSFNSKSFSKVLSVSALHYYSNPKKAVSEFYRVLQSNGSLILIDWCRDTFYFKIFDRVNRIINKHHVSTYTSKDLKYLLVNAGFKVDNVVKWSHGLWPLIGIKASKN